MHHECVKFEEKKNNKKKAKLHFGFAIKMPPLKLCTLYFFFFFLSEMKLSFCLKSIAVASPWVLMQGGVVGCVCVGGGF